MNKSKLMQRQINYDKFVNQILDDVLMESDKIENYEFDDSTKRFTLYTEIGLLDYFPMSDKLLFRKDNKWDSEGLNWLLNYVKL